VRIASQSIRERSAGDFNLVITKHLEVVESKPIVRPAPYMAYARADIPNQPVKTFPDVYRCGAGCGVVYSECDFLEQ